MRALLPADLWGCPPDQRLRALRELVETEDYDWRRAILEPEVPSPPVEVIGVSRLASDDLVHLAYALATSTLPDESDRLRMLLRELLTRPHGELELRQLRSREVMRTSAVTVDQAQDHARDWVRSLNDDLFGGRHGWYDSDGYYYAGAY